MKIVVSSRGSRGDVHPLIEICTALHQGGHHTSICVPTLFEDIVTQRRLKASFYSEDMELNMAGLGSGLQAIQTALAWFSKSIDEQFDYMVEKTDGADAMVTSVNEIMAPTVAEYRKIPHFRVAYSPVLPGNHPPPLVPWQTFPAWGNRLMWSLINGFTGLFIRKIVNKKRKQLGLPPMGPVADYFTANSHTVMTINPVLAPPCNSWNDVYDFCYTGYCYGDINGALESGLEEFLAAGPAPIYIGFGSVSVKNPKKFTDLVLESVSATGTRVVIGKGWTGLGNADLPKTIYTINDAPHGTLFPRLAGVMHHGGCGTTHTAARAGLPQFILPQIADQFYWGHRIHCLGLGPKPVVPKKLTARKLTKVLRDMSENSAYRWNAKALASKNRFKDGTPKVVDTIVSTVEGGDSNRSLSTQVASLTT
jgi:UDP:flavonoid glycosyltransferase YjiC (YdhE family)